MRVIFISFFLYFLSFSIFGQSDSIHIDGIVIWGNERTKTRIIQREIGIKLGQKIALADTTKFIEQTKNKLINLNLFLNVKINFNIQNPQKELIIQVSERGSFMAWPTVILADRNFNEWWYNQNRDLKRIIYGINFMHRNIGGRAEELVLNFETGFSNKGALIYKIPYIDKVQKTGIEFLNFYNISPQISYKTEDDKILFLRNSKPLSTKWNSRIALRRRNNFYERQRLEIAFSNETVQDTILMLNPIFFPKANTNFKFITTNYSFEGDHRDNINYPLYGHYFIGRATFYKGLSSQSDFKMAEIYLNYDYHFKIKYRLYADIILRTKWTAGNTPPYVIFAGLGYKNDFVRGYDLNVIEGQRFALAKWNIKYELLKTGYRFNKPKIISTKNQKVPLGIYLRTFADYGYAFNSNSTFINSNLSNKNLIGYGIGLDVASYYYNAFRLSMAWNQKGERGLFLSVGRRI